MSKRLTYDVGASRHPLLMADPIARDVLWWLADAAQERNDCRIIYPVSELAKDMDRPHPAVKHAVRRIKNAGLLRQVGVGDYDKRLEVLVIVEEELSTVVEPEHPRNAEITQEVSRGDHSGSATTIGSPSGRDRVAIGSRSVLDRVVIGSSSGLHRVVIGSSTRARVLNSEQGTVNWELGTGNEEQRTQDTKEWSGEPAPLHLGLAEAAEPAAAPKRTPGEERIAAAVDEVMALIAPKGQTQATLATWRNRLKARLAAKGVAADAVADRVRAVKAAWHFVSNNGWHIEQKRNGPVHFFTVTLRNDENVDRDAARNPERLARSGNGSAGAYHGGTGSTGVYRQPDHYEDSTGMNDPATWNPPVEDILDTIGGQPAKAKKGGG